MQWKATEKYSVGNGFTTAAGETHAGTSFDVQIIESSGAMAGFVATATALATLLAF